MFFFRLNSNFCTLGNTRIAHSPKDFCHPCRHLLFINRPPSTDSGFRPPLLHGYPYQIHFGDLGHPTDVMKDTSRLAPRSRLRLGGLLWFAGTVSWSASLRAYEVPLSPAAVHDAWTLGQRNDPATAEFLSPYSKQVTEGAQQVPHVAEIEVLTPFALVLDQSRQNLSGYSEQQALQAYKQRGDTVIVRIRLMLPGAYPQAERSPRAPPAAAGQNAALRPENFWQSFQFVVKQHGRVIDARSVHNKPVYSSATKASSATLDGQTVWLEFDAKAVASEEIVVEVTTPDAKTVGVGFDLKKLR
jgi:hypothetical protein